MTKSTLAQSLFTSTKRETIKLELLTNERNVNAYRPNIGLQLWDSFKSGWCLLQNILTFVIQLWSLFLLGTLGFLGYRNYFKKK